MHCTREMETYTGVEAFRPEKAQCTRGRDLLPFMAICTEFRNADKGGGGGHCTQHPTVCTMMCAAAAKLHSGIGLLGLGG